MKVGIITFHHTVNFGATLQAYALWKTIKSLGHDVEIIDYRPYEAIKFYLREIQPINYKMHINFQALPNLIKAWKMRQFLLSHIKLSQKKCFSRKNMHNLYQNYDVVVCGSDQIWCLDSFRGLDPAYFIDFINSKNTCRKISYAPSFGNTETLGKNRELINQFINNFDAISVRDNNSLRLLKEECNRQAEVVLDPSFLVEYDEIISKPKVSDKYLLIYSNGQITPEDEDVIKVIAKEQNLAIFSIGKYSRVAHKNIIGVSPKEWLGYFSEAAYVVTNTYHGTIFSLKFKKPFTALANINKKNKTNDLLNILGLEKRLCYSEQVHIDFQTMNEDILNIDYDLVSHKIEKEVINSKNYLLEALDGQWNKKNQQNEKITAKIM
ncbi:MAG: polysaccharide pyruvyl transferase family protein [Nostocaceae cyanobacterium]|nr:polysaccharide pyruvyl transferase family protein [Nostocaceae cyanobacterium]